MQGRWKLQILTPKRVVRKHITDAWKLALKDLAAWMRSTFINDLVHGGPGLQGIEETEFYRFITSADGLSQLGINADQPPKLLDAYKKSFKVLLKGNALIMKFGDKAALKLGTPHPASGTGQLKISSWMEWVLDKTIVADRGYVPRSRLSDKLQKYPRLSAPLGGLMLPRGAYGSLGLWRFPLSIVNYEDKWLNQNVGHISRRISQQMVKFLQARLR